MLLSSSNRKYPLFPLLYFSVVVCLRCLLHHSLSLIAYMFRENREFCFHYYCVVYDECKYSDTFWLADHTCLFVQYILSFYYHWMLKYGISYFRLFSIFLWQLFLEITCEGQSISYLPVNIENSDSFNHSETYRFIYLWGWLYSRGLLLPWLSGHST